MNLKEKMKKEKKATKKEIKWLIKGLELDDIGKSKEAIECYNKALEINPRFADAWNNKGAALDDIGKSKEAIECYNKALDINPKHLDACYNKAQALKDDRKFNEAVQCYSKLLEKNPDFEFSGDVLNCYFKAAEMKGAKELLIGYVERYSNNPWGEIEKLIKLLERKYNIIINKRGLEKLLDFIKNKLNETKKKSDYNYLKNIIADEKPNTKEEYADAFLKHCGENFDDKLEILKEFLDDGGFKLDILDIKELIQQRKTLKELEIYEEEILGNKKLNEEDKLKISKLKKKIKKWKKEGYNLEEIETILNKY